ncbi:hypothetical protein BV20DRAFT_340548 [Pilatotrama ljubarskyi]|nr:hypothetical protein BV20DRAFT_340548 [Pilatotrama ljubarskyi]
MVILALAFPVHRRYPVMHSGVVPENSLRARHLAPCLKITQTQWLFEAFVLAMLSVNAVFQRILVLTLYIQRERFTMASSQVSVSQPLLQNPLI